MGAVYLTGRELTGDGRCSASGSVDVAVLYIPEKGEGPRVLRFQLPFQCYGDSLGTGECDFLDIRGELRGIDTRALNPRKVLTRANIDLYPSGCRRVRLELCDGAEEEQEDLQLLREERTCRVVAAVREREFTFVEELPVSAGRAGGEEAVQLRCDVRSNDVKLIGSKLVVKGLISASLLYREEGGRLALLQQDLPFSQILDGAGLEEDWDSEAAFRLLSAECRLGSESAPDDAHVFTVTLLLRTRVTVCRQERMGYIADLYSTAGEIDCQTETLRLTEDAQRVVRRQNVRELLETGVGVKSVVDASVVCGAAQVGGSALEIPVSARCLYLDENDALRSVTREFTASWSGGAAGGLSGGGRGGMPGGDDDQRSAGGDRAALPPGVYPGALPPDGAAVRQRRGAAGAAGGPGAAALPDPAEVFRGRDAVGGSEAVPHHRPGDLVGERGRERGPAAQRPAAAGPAGPVTGRPPGGGQKFERKQSAGGRRRVL